MRANLSALIIGGLFAAMCSPAAYASCTPPHCTPPPPEFYFFDGDGEGSSGGRFVLGPGQETEPIAVDPTKNKAKGSFGPGNVKFQSFTSSGTPWYDEIWSPPGGDSPTNGAAYFKLIAQGDAVAGTYSQFD
jgi:hypothetical protein